MLVTTTVAEFFVVNVTSVKEQRNCHVQGIARMGSWLVV